MKIHTSTGRPYPLGATVTPNGINFALFSRHATRIYLELFREPDDREAWSSIELDPLRNRTGDVWHVFAHNLHHGQLYGFRADGPYDPLGLGHRFNVNKLLADPYARALAGTYNLDDDAPYGYDRSSPLADLSFSTLDSAGSVPKSVALDSSPINWEGDVLPRRPLSDSLIYECHVKGLTAHPSSAVQKPGTFAGIVEKIPHLLDLGVTAVELLPVHEFNEGEPSGTDPITGNALTNYWGYSSLGFFAPEMTYAANPNNAVFEFQDMVKELHRAGIEVILDVVFNHTGEGNEKGPTLSFRGLDNTTYYMLDNTRKYRNYSGCGNTLNCNHPVVKTFILDCLRYWMVEMHVDGFRFDLATILGRRDDGAWIGDLSLLKDIAGDPILRGSKLIAEAWDADGLYKVGSFPKAWAEWNGRFRDDVRRFIRGDDNTVKDLARRIGGSYDLFSKKQNSAPSINFVTCHDGFPLRDVFTYARKHNEQNGEENRDGSNENFSTNLGVEGELDDPQLIRARMQLAKNALVLLASSRGTPMMLAGDELWRTQGGNNNAYNQDNPISWLNWENNPESDEILRFSRMIFGLRSRHPALRRPLFASPFEELSMPQDIHWHGVELDDPDWSWSSHSIALHIQGRVSCLEEQWQDDDFYIIHNAWEESLSFELPPLPWRRLVDTSLPAPEDIRHEDLTPNHEQLTHYKAAPRSCILLIAST